MKAFKATGREGQSLRERPLIEPSLIHVFDWFNELNRTRFNYVGMVYALAPLQPESVLAYMRLKQIIPHPVEYELLCEVDSIFLELMSENETKK